MGRSRAQGVGPPRGTAGARPRPFNTGDGVEYARDHTHVHTGMRPGMMRARERRPTPCHSGRRYARRSIAGADNTGKTELRPAGADRRDMGRPEAVGKAARGRTRACTYWPCNSPGARTSRAHQPARCRRRQAGWLRFRDDRRSAVSTDTQAAPPRVRDPCPGLPAPGRGRPGPGSARAAQPAPDRKAAGRNAGTGLSRCADGRRRPFSASAAAGSQRTKAAGKPPTRRQREGPGERAGGRPTMLP